MESLLRVLKKPEYFYNPKQFLKRLAQFTKKPTNGEPTIPLFGQDFQCSVSDDIGRAVHTYGLYDLCVSEALWLLVNSGDCVCDVGANVGYFTNLFAAKVGAAGSVHAFEPNPQVLPQLLQNSRRRENVKIHSVGLSDSTTRMDLYAPDSYDGNRGLASLQVGSGKKIATVDIVMLDDLRLLPRIIKMDIEGHELSALKGSEKTLSNVEHIVFEDHDVEKNGVKNFLKQKHFSIYYLEKNFSYLRLKNTDEPYKINRTEPPNYLASKWPYADLLKIFTKSRWTFIDYITKL